MKNKLLLLLLSFALVFSVCAFAGEGSDTIGDENMLLQLRYSYSVYDYKSKWEDDLGLYNDFDFSSHAGYLQMDYGINDYVDIYGLLGYKYLDADEDRHPDDYGLGYIHSMVWGAGLKATFVRMDNGLYFGGGIGITHAFDPGKTTLYVDGDDIRYDYNEFNVVADLHAGWKIKKIGLTPYIGAEFRYTRLFLEQIDGSEVVNDETAILFDDHNFGMYVGLDYYLNNRLYFNVEGHFFDYEGVSASVGYLFDSAIPNLSSGGMGTDTVGACHLLAQVRYSYAYNNYDTDYYRFIGDDVDNDFEFESHSVYLQLTYGLTDYVDVYGLLGYRNVCFDIDGNLRFSDNFDALLWGVGLKSTFYRADNGFFVGGGLGLTHAFNPTKRAMTYYDVEDDDYSSYKYQYNEMNLTGDLHAGWHFANIGLTPYFGVEYRYTVLTMEAYRPGYHEIDDDSSARFEQKNRVGVFAGVNWLINDRFFLNVEGHAIDYWGGSCGFGYRFDICGAPEPAPAPAPTPVIEPKLEPMSKY
ncbi:MAG: TonB-dependent receptor [Deltaproteobacteria bacterium]|nr:TonB-dependent receptor [Candidatus Zymogenaceae bacterium]